MKEGQQKNLNGKRRQIKQKEKVTEIDKRKYKEEGQKNT